MKPPSHDKHPVPLQPMDNSRDKRQPKGLIHILLKAEYSSLQRCYQDRLFPFDDKDENTAKKTYEDWMSPNNKDILSRRLQRKIHKYCHALGFDLTYFKIDSTHFTDSSRFELLIANLLKTLGGIYTNVVGKQVLDGKLEKVEPAIMARFTELYYDALYEVTMERRNGRRLYDTDDDYQKIKQLMKRHTEVTNDSYISYLDQMFPEAFRLMNSRVPLNFLLDPTAKTHFLGCIQDDYDNKWSDLIVEYALQKLDHFTHEHRLVKQYLYKEKNDIQQSIYELYNEVGDNLGPGGYGLRWIHAYPDERPALEPLFAPSTASQSETPSAPLNSQDDKRYSDLSPVGSSPHEG